MDEAFHVLEKHGYKLWREACGDLLAKAGEEQLCLIIPAPTESAADLLTHANTSMDWAAAALLLGYLLEEVDSARAVRDSPPTTEGVV